MAGVLVVVMAVGGLAMVMHRRTQNALTTTHQKPPPSSQPEKPHQTAVPAAPQPVVPVLKDSALMAPAPPPRTDPYAAARSRRQEPPLSREECERHRKAVPIHAKATDLVTVREMPSTSTKLLCVIYTYSKKHPSARTMFETWLPLCDGALVLSDTNETAISAVAVPHAGKEEWGNVWQKTRANWRYVHENYFEEFDFFIFGGDDYFVIPANLKTYLASDEIRRESAERGVYLGRRFKANGNPQRIFNSGGAGYVFDRRALRTLIQQLDRPHCKPTLRAFYEDVMVAQCLKNAAQPIHAYDTRDPQGRERFHPFQPGHHLSYRANTRANDWYPKYSIDLKFGPDCCSPDSVSYHYVKPDLALHLHALLHRCRTVTSR